MLQAKFYQDDEGCLRHLLVKLKCYIDKSIQTLDTVLYLKHPFGSKYALQPSWVCCQKCACLDLLNFYYSSLQILLTLIKLARNIVVLTISGLQKCPSSIFTVVLGHRLVGM